MDTFVPFEDDGLRKVPFYRKPKRGSILNFNLNHHLERNCSVLRTLPRCAKHMVTDPHDQEKEVRRVKKALISKGYPEWILQLLTKKNKKWEGPDHDRRGNITISVSYLGSSSGGIQATGSRPSAQAEY